MIRCVGVIYTRRAERSAVVIGDSFGGGASEGMNDEKYLTVTAINTAARRSSAGYKYDHRAPSGISNNYAKVYDSAKAIHGS